MASDPASGPFVPSADRRAAKRTKVFLVGEITPPGATPTRAHVLDISDTGARVHSDQQQTVGGEVTLAVHDFEAAGNVEWVAGQRFGMKFVQPNGSTVATPARALRRLSK